MSARQQRELERCRHLTQLFVAHRVALTELAVVAGNSRPAPALVSAFADLYDRWRDVDDPLNDLRRSAIASGRPDRRGEVVAWLVDRTELDEEEMADVAGLSPAELSMLKVRR